MAGKARRKCEFSEKDTMFVGRFVYDVLVYTLTKCGFPQTKLPNTDCKENVYRRAHFLKIAGASVLRVSLLMREKWKQAFISRRNSSESDGEDLSPFLGTLAINCSLSRTRTTQSTVEVFLALCNEVLLFIHHEGIDIDVIKLMKSVSSCILFLSGPSQDVSEKIEGLFDEFDNISGYTRWITNFIKKYAIPYGYRDDVSDLFLERVKRQFIDLKKAIPSGTPSVSILKDHLGYLPLELFSAIGVEESAPLPENLVSASGSILPYDRKSPEPAKLPGASGSGVPPGSKLRGRRSTGPEEVCEQTAKGEQSSKNSPELGIEDDLGQMRLIAEEASQTSHGAIPKRKTPKKGKRKK
ncbi:hypothetical protein AVEN_25420-1 [Araneus ventricosus]|uniref:Uncharacterized protein n=1 Tax=Araneus ventricosus TaxID=182803 RepID=A0A4Y2IBS8_ARAVE|nr:hypothetical protein AVEN_25420-1 [Araneus ventricosus]